MTTPFYPHAAGVLGIITLAIWLHLFFGRGWFWRVRKLDADRSEGAALSDTPSVVAIVPARNEAETIEQVVQSLLAQDYRGDFSIVVVDDHSEDSTAEVARRAAAVNGASERVQIVSAAALPEGWTGKVWAMNCGVAAATAARPPAFYWFTDADVSHAPETLRRLAALAAQNRADLASLMVLLQAKTLPERALIPAFLYFFLMLYPPQWIADEELNTAGAAGGCVLLRRGALERIGGLAAIRSEVIDDCTLAKRVKQSGRVWMGLTRKSVSLRAYGTWSEIRDLIARTAFTQLRYSTLLLAGTTAGMLLTYAAPIALLFTHDSISRSLGLAAWLLMSLSFLPTVRFYRLSPLWAPLLPLTALFYTYATLLSALRYWRGHGGQWKGRAQASRGAD